MPAHRNLFTLWLLLLLHVSGSAMKFNLFKKEGNPLPMEGDVRLFGGGVSEGRVEIYHDGKWGTVCDDGWDLAEAQVVCRQLHFPGAKSVEIGKNYGKGAFYTSICPPPEGSKITVMTPGPIWLDDMKCEGTEDYLSKCAFASWGVTDCSHKEDVGVICETSYTNSTIDDSTHTVDQSISLSDELGKIFDSGIGCDFLISVQSATGNKQEDGTPEVVEKTVCAHKLILSQFPLFNASEGISNITVDISQSCQPLFTSFIRYIYTRKMDVSFSSAECIHWMAYKFGVTQLMEDTGRLFSKILPDDSLFYTQVSLYHYAEKTGDLVLQENCIQYLAWNYQNLTRSPAWSHISVELLESLLMRSDLVVPDEYFLLQSVESWITERGNSTSLETQVDLLSRIRFPMIPVEALYSLEFNSTLYSTHKNMYREHVLKAFQFNVLLFSNLISNKLFDREDDDYQPRIYTAEPWSIAIDRYNQYDYSTTKWLTTPIHTSLLFKNDKISWEVNVFKNQYECQNRGLRCEYPLARLYPQNHLPERTNVFFHNRLLLMCHGKHICQVQDFKNNMAVNGTQALAYPCPDDKYIFHFVVRPVYV